MRWFEKHLPKDGSVRIHRFDQTLVGLSIAGPKSQQLLQKLVDVDVSSKAFRFMDFREMAVGGAPAMVNRITYSGDLGYEIWMAPAYQRLVYKAMKEAGEEFGLVDFGMRALLSMRLEKNYPTWFRELRPIYGPFEGAMDRFTRMEKNDFIGREAAAKEQAALKSGESPKLRRVSFIVDALDADVMGDEPIWAKVSTDYGTVEKPHGYGAPRFDATGKEVRGSKAAEGASAVRGIVDGVWRVVGWVTSGGYAH
jgi:dimethylglycine dehydrogenase